MPVDLRIEPALEPRAQGRAALRRQTVERAGGAQGGLEQRATLGETGEDVSLPRDRERAAFVGDEFERVVGRFDQSIGAAVELLAEAPFRCRKQQAFVGKPRRGIDAELEAGQMADRLGTYADLSVGGDGDR